MHCITGTATNGMACGTDVDCGGAAGSCAPDANCYFGPPQTIQMTFFGGGKPCVVSVVAAASTGTLDATSGSLSVMLPLAARVYLPVGGCPVCTGGLCQGGKNNGGGCIPVGAGMTSVDCLPNDADFVGTASLSLAGFGTGTSTLSDSGGIFCLGQANAGAYGLPPARQISVTGALAGDLHDGNPHAAAVVTNLCIGATGNGIIDAAADLPGPGSMTVSATLELVPE
jgi:hypothetical protein